MKTEYKNGFSAGRVARIILGFIIGVIIACLLISLISCTKEQPCDCGTVISSEFNGRMWVTEIDYCNSIETMLMFDYKQPGTVLCKLQEITLKPCEP